MGFFKSFFQIANEIITLGGASTLEESKNKYQKVLIDYQRLFDEIKAVELSINNLQKNIGDVISMALKTLLKVEKLLGRFHQSLNADHISNTSALNDITKFNNSYYSALSAGFGGVVGGATAVGAWAIVSVLGSASTGTAIASISGVAATNATLAWFGGGALAAGGAGMTGGMMVLGGIVALPMVYFATKGSYKKAQEVDIERNKLEDEVVRLESIKKYSTNNLQQIQQYVLAIEKHCIEFINESEELLRTVYPHGWFSYLHQLSLKAFGGTPYSDEQQRAIARIDKNTIEFLKFFESKT